MIAIDEYLKVLPEPHRKFMLTRRWKSKESYPNTYDDTQVAPSIAVAIASGVYWGRAHTYRRVQEIHEMALAGEFDKPQVNHAELIQHLVDALVDHPPGTCTAKEWQAEIADALAAAEAAGFKPSDR